MNMSLLPIRSRGLAPLVFLCSMLALAGISASAQNGTEVELNPQHPDSYTVRKGDTLWDISAMFLRDPWYWPEIWQINPQVENPHLIYPGDILTLIYVDGQPKIQVQRAAEAESGGDTKLQPRIRSEVIDEAITAISFEKIGAFLSKGSVLAADEIEKLPYIAAIREGHLVAAAGNDVYVRGDISGVNAGYSVINIGDPIIDPDDQKIIGYRGNFVGEGVILQVGDPSTLHLVKTVREAREGDRLLTQDFDIPMQFIPRPPERQVEGRIIDVLDGLSIIGQYQIVVLNRGARHSLEAGTVLSIWQAGQLATDRFTTNSRGDQFLLPDEKAGTLMVFKAYDRISYALIMEATTDIHILDKVSNPK